MTGEAKRLAKIQYRFVHYSRIWYQKDQEEFQQR